VLFFSSGRGWYTVKQDPLRKGQCINYLTTRDIKKNPCPFVL